MNAIVPSRRRGEAVPRPGRATGPPLQRKSVTLVAIAGLLWIVCGGCAAFGSRGDRPVAPTANEQGRTPQPDVVEERPTNGSLWSGDRSRTFLFQDPKAGRVGDVVTVRIVENAQGSKGAKTASGRTSSVTAGTDAFLAIPGSTTGKLQADASFSDAFDGSGSTSRSGALTADVTAVVTAVYPNGNMAIEGRREVLINDEKERIWVSGVIRPEDIGPKNRILSTVIADAKIEYTGAGVLSDKQRPGWLVRILDWVWPF